MADWVGSAPLFVAPRRQAQKGPVGPGAGTGQDGALSGPKPPHPPGADDGKEPEEEPYSDDPVRNRQKELQDAIVAAEDAESILSTVRELDGAIVISTAMHRLGKIASGNAADIVRDSRFTILMEKFKLRLPFFGSRQISNSLHGLGNLMYREHGSWVQMVSIQTQRRIRDFEPQHVSNTLWACARMQLKDPLMLQALLGRAIEDIPRSCPLDVSIVTWACATLKLKEVEWLRAVVRARLEFADFSPQNMSNFVWGLATLSFRNDNMVLAVGREAARKIQDFIPQELSNFAWALATLDLCDNLMLRAVAEEVDRRVDILHTWDPQSLSNMMWAYATLAVKDDPLFRNLLDASIARMADHDPQNLANSSWAAAMVSFRCSRFLDAVAESTVRQISSCQTLHLAQLAFAFTRCCFPGERHGLMRAMLEETMGRVEEFAPQSLFDVHDALLHFGTLTTAPNPIERCLNIHYDGLVARMEAFAKQCARGLPTVAQAMDYRRTIEQLDIVTLGVPHTIAFLRHFGLLCPEDDPFIKDARRQIQAWRDAEAVKDPVSRSIFHRAQCAWQLGLRGDASGALADGVFESGEPTNGGPDRHGLVVCRLRHPREGDAEIQALCAALCTSAFKSGKAVQGLGLHLHLSDVPCVSCLGATLQFSFRYPGMLRVSFDRGRQLHEDTVPIPRPPPPPSRKGNLLPYVPVPELTKKAEAGGNASGESNLERCLMRREGPDCRETTSFYLSNSRAPRRTDGAASGGAEAVPHKVLPNLKGSSQQTYYFSSRPDFYSSNDYDGCG
uniref:RNA-editing substrate-binding complex 6 protein domain-containing protein n=1 Tax=Alexandrium monilatum TaxID=311494 RepID=A0A7S4T011_9DINO